MSLFEIVLEKHITEGGSDFWLEMIKQLISGITIGLILALIGYFIWKKQNLYSRKFDTYIGLISKLSEVYRLAVNSIVFDRFTYIDVPELKDFYANNKDFSCELQQNKLLFITFFGNEHLDKIEYFINIERNIEDVKIEVKNGSSVFTKKYPKEEQTIEIINLHKQQVIDKMTKYLSDLESVSKSFKKYII